MKRVLKWIGWGCVLVVALAALWWVTHRDEARAYVRAIVIGSTMAEVPVVSSVTGAMTGEPERLELDTAGELDARAIVPEGTTDRPQDEGGVPTIVVLVPRSATEAELQGIADAQHALARAGLAAWAVRLPAVADLGGATAPGEVLVAALKEISAAPSTRDGKMALVGAGGGASLAIIAAASPALDGRVSAVLALQPYADVQGLFRLVVTGTTRLPDGTDLRHNAGARFRRTVALAVVDALETAGLPKRIATIVRTGIRVAGDPLKPLASMPARLVPDNLEPVSDVLAAEDPLAFDTAWADLPLALRNLADARSPMSVVDEVDAPITLIVPEDDALLPAADAERLADAATDALLVRTPLIDPGGDAELTVAELEPLLAEAVRFLMDVDA